MQSTDLTNTFVFDRVLFFGRSLCEYVRMFALDLEELKGLSVLDCAAGPASFACEAAVFDVSVVACDPHYGASVEELGLINLLQREEALSRQSKVEHLFDEERSAQFVKEKEQALKKFIADYGLAASSSSRRYVKASLPELPFADKSFDFLLSSNFLFLYSDYAEGGMLMNSAFDYRFHLQSILEMIRVTRREIRLYPLKGPHRTEPEHGFISRLRDDLADKVVSMNVVPVSYRDVKGAHHMLRIVCS